MKVCNQQLLEVLGSPAGNGQTTMTLANWILGVSVLFCLLEFLSYFFVLFTFSLHKQIFLQHNNLKR